MVKDSRDEEVDTGQPIAELRRLEEPVSTGFRERLRQKLERRRLAVQAFDLGSGGVFEVIRVWLDSIFSTLGPSPGADSEPPRPSSERGVPPQENRTSKEMKDE